MVSYLLCSLIKNWEEEDPPWRTTTKIDEFCGWFFRGGPLPPSSWSGNIVNRNPPQGGVFFRSEFWCTLISFVLPLSPYASKCMSYSKFMSVIISLTLSSLVSIFMYYSIFMRVWVFMYRISLNLSLVHYASMFMLYSMNMSVWVYMHCICLVYVLTLAFSVLHTRTQVLATHIYICVRTNICVCMCRKKERERERQTDIKYLYVTIFSYKWIQIDYFEFIHSHINVCLSIDCVQGRRGKEEKKVWYLYVTTLML